MIFVPFTLHFSVYSTMTQRPVSPTHPVFLSIRGEEHPSHVYKHDECRDHQAGDHGDAPDPRVVDRQEQKTDAHEDRDVTARAPTLFLEKMTIMLKQHARRHMRH